MDPAFKQSTLSLFLARSFVLFDSCGFSRWLRACSPRGLGSRRQRRAYSTASAADTGPRSGPYRVNSDLDSLPEAQMLVLAVPGLEWPHAESAAGLDRPSCFIT